MSVSKLYLGCRESQPVPLNQARKQTHCWWHKGFCLSPIHFFSGGGDPNLYRQLSNLVLLTTSESYQSMEVSSYVLMGKQKSKAKGFAQQMLCPTYVRKKGEIASRNGHKSLFVAFHTKQDEVICAYL